jgi:LPXTG-motif cell wall-anchored protein
MSGAHVPKILVLQRRRTPVVATKIGEMACREPDLDASERVRNSRRCLQALGSVRYIFSPVARPGRLDLSGLLFRGLLVFRGYRSILPTLGLGALCLLVSAPTASAVTVTPPGIYTNVIVGSVLVYDGSGPATNITPPLPLDTAGETGWDSAVAPDGKTLYSVFGGNGFIPKTKIVIQDLPGGALQRVLTIAYGNPNSPKRIALSPDGATAYLSADGLIFPVTLSSGQFSSGFGVANVMGLAVSPNGRRLYVSTGTHIQALDAATGAVVHDRDLGQPAGAIKVSADGETIYVIGDADGTSAAHLFKIKRSSFSITDQAVVPGSLAGNTSLQRLGLALSPDQSLLYVTGSQQSQDLIFAVPVRASDLRVGPVLHLVDGTDGFADLNDAAFTPDGKTLYTYVDGDQSGGFLVTIDVATNTVTSQTQQHNGMTSALTQPDQAPVAAFKATARCAGTATSFDASASTVASGSIASYAWDFGDGTTKVTSGPTTSHVYAKAGRYPATVTETDSAGTSTTVVFDGQTVIRNGGPSARVRHTVTVGACAVPPVRTFVEAAKSSNVASSLPVTGSNTPEGLLTSGLLIAAGLGLTRIRRRRTRSVR